MKWACGVITVPSRRNDLLLQTLDGLNRAGFPKPRLFVDGHACWKDYEVELEAGCSLNLRFPPPVRAWANWFLGLSELYLREPASDLYGMFQDDVLFCRYLREYCEAFPGLIRPDAHYGERFYLNLYCAEGVPARGNPDLSAAHGRDGWFKSNQLGCGALALIFPNRAVRALLSAKHMINRPNDERDNPDRQGRNLDGSVSEALCRSEQLRNREPYTEWCHRPSLVQHSGEVSSINGRRWTEGARDWPGPEYSPLPLLSRPEPAALPLPHATLQEWEEERARLLAAIDGDRARQARADAGDFYTRKVAEYERRLAAHEKMRPAAG